MKAFSQLNLRGADSSNGSLYTGTLCSPVTISLAFTAHAEDRHYLQSPQAIALHGTHTTQEAISDIMCRGFVLSKSTREAAATLTVALHKPSFL